MVASDWRWRHMVMSVVKKGQKNSTKTNCDDNSLDNHANVKRYPVNKPQ